MLNPAENLVGLHLEGDWEVYEKIKKQVNGSGGNFSICYKVRRKNEIAFLKAVDLSRALGMDDSMRWLQILTTKHNYEMELLSLCSGRKMDKVVSILGSGRIIPEEHNPAKLPVHYLIFELADKTIRDHVLNAVLDIDNACLMRSLHNVAVGISQLHSAGIAHQDIKPSNVLMFDPLGNSKVSDLGSAENINKQSILFDYSIAGDPTYAPPELLYRHLNANWDVRRKATDLFHLGSLVCFYYTQDAMTSLLRTFLPIEYCWTNWNGNYNVVLPYLRYAFGETLAYLEECLQRTFSDEKTVIEIMNLVSYLCDPDPLHRGHPENRMIPENRYSMERFITSFNVLANRFESKLL